MKKLFIIIVILFFCSSSLYVQEKKSSVGGTVGTNYLVGDSPLTNSIISPNLGLFYSYQFSSRFGLLFQTGFGKLGVDYLNSPYWTSLIPVELIGCFSLFPNSKFNPLLRFGIGGLSFTTDNSPRYYDGMAIGGLGFDIGLSSKLSLLLTTDFRYTTGDDFDNAQGGLKDGYLSIQTGLAYHFGKSKKRYEDEYYEEEFPDNDVIAELLESASDELSEQTTDTVVTKITPLQQQIENLKLSIQEKDAEIEELKTISQSKTETIAQLEDHNLNTNQAQMGDTPFIGTNTSSNVNEIYQMALEYYQTRNFHEAIAQFSNLLNDHLNHSLVSNFNYWIGESHFNLGNYEAALEAFKSVLNYENSHKLDDALIMAGLCYLKLGNGDKANKNFEELLQKYPDSEFAEKAKRYIE